MKPVNFDYVQKKEQIPFPDLEYDYKLGLSKLNGNVFIRESTSVLSSVTKTFTQRETDDDIPSPPYLTKTEMQRESDDEATYMKSKHIKILMMTKTDTERESDDE